MVQDDLVCLLEKMKDSKFIEVHLMNRLIEAMEKCEEWIFSKDEFVNWLSIQKWVIVSEK